MTLLQADAAPPSTTLVILIVVGFLVIFPLFWCGVVGLLSTVGGWGRLAAAYPGTGSEVVTERFDLAGGSVGVVSYRSTLKVGVGEWGVGLSVLLPFRFMHPPIAIPWEAVQSCGDARFAFWSGSELRLHSGQRIMLWGPAGAAIREAWARREAAARQPV
jgi:hypothetical protein